MHLLQHLAQYAATFQLSNHSPATIHYAVRHLADSLACALAAVNQPLIQDLYKWVRRRESVQGTNTGLRLWASGDDQSKLRPGDFVLVTGTMVRHLDCNDLYIPPAGGNSQNSSHCSDGLASVLALAAVAKLTSQQLIAAIIRLYDTQVYVSRLMPFLDVGIHTVSQLNFGIVAANGGSMEASEEQLCTAMSLAMTTGSCVNTWLKQKQPPATSTSKDTSHDGVPTVKDLAVGLINQHVMRCIVLSGASPFVTAPTDCIEMYNSYFDADTSSADQQARYDAVIADMQNPSHTAMTQHLIKQYPCQFNVIAAVQAVYQLKAEHNDITHDNVAAITIYGHNKLCGGVQGGAAAFKPQTVGDANHSTPYCVTAALLYDDFTYRNVYDSERYKQSDVQTFMRDRIMLEIDAEFDRAMISESKLGCRVEIKLHDGNVYSQTVEQTKGHPAVPLTDSELQQKMHTLLDSSYGQQFADQLWLACAKLEHDVERAASTEDSQRSVASLIGLLQNAKLTS